MVGGESSPAARTRRAFALPGIPRQSEAGIIVTDGESSSEGYSLLTFGSIANGSTMLNAKGILTVSGYLPKSDLPG